MKAKIELDITPLDVQYHVQVKYKGPLPPPNANAPTTVGISNLPTRNLDSVTLEKLCDDFTNAMFTAARLERPPEAVGPPEKEDLTLNMRWIGDGNATLFLKGDEVAELYESASGKILVKSLLHLARYARVEFDSVDEAKKAAEKSVLQWFERMMGDE